MRKHLVRSVALGAVLSASPLLFGTAQTFDGSEIKEYRIDSNDCFGCEPTDIRSEADLRDYLAETRATIDSRNNARNGAVDGGVFIGSGTTASGVAPGTPQTVFLNFDAGGEPTFPVCMDTTGDGAADTLFTGAPFLDHVYTQEERDAVQAAIEADYADFNFIFTQTEPLSGDFTTLEIGDNDDPLDCSNGSNITLTPTFGVGILFGMAESIDFLNANMDDNAFVDASFWEFLAQLGGAGLLETFSGISVADDFGGDLEAAVSSIVVNQTANTGAHEVGHILGLRHQNSFGAPGDGIPDTGARSPLEFIPIIENVNASETILHTMASGASVGLGLADTAVGDRFFSERSSVRLAVNDTPFIINEDDIRADGQDRVNFQPIAVPNTILQGTFQDSEFSVESVIIEGSLDSVGEIDSYFFRGRAGEFFNLELVSLGTLGQSFAEGILGQVSVFQVNPDGSEELIATNAQTFESIFDTEIFDAQLPVTGLYRMQIAAPDVVFLDLDGALPLDPIPLTAVGGADLLTGEYTVFAFTALKPLDSSEELADPAAALDLLSDFNLIVFEDLETRVSIDGRVFVGGDLVGPSATFGSALNGQAGEDFLVVAGGIFGSSKNINNGGNVRYGTELTARLNLNGGGVATQDPTISTNAAENVLRALSTDLGNLEANSYASIPTRTHGPVRFNASPDANGVAVFNIEDGDRLLSNDFVQQLEINANGASAIVINVGGKNIDFDRGNLVGAFNNKSLTSRIIWNFPEALTLDIERSLSGTILAPEAALKNRSDLTGTVIVADITAGGTIRNNTYVEGGLLSVLEAE